MIARESSIGRDGRRATLSVTESASLRGLAVLLSALGACVAAAALTVIPYGRSYWDFLFVLNGAYRIGLGQVPHLDFASPIGCLTLYLTFLAERIFPSGQPFVGLHALFWLLLAPPLAALAGRFESGVRFCAAAALLALMVLVPYTLDKTNLSEISFFATYNRFATGTLFLLALWYVLPKRRWDFLLLGYLVGLLFFLKITSAAVAVGLLMAAAITRRAATRPVVLALLLFAVACGLIEAATGLVGGYLRDVQFMASVNRGQVLYAIGFAAFRNWAPLAVGAAVALPQIPGLLRPGRVLPAWRGPIARRDGWQAFAIDTVVLLGAALAAESQNTGGIGLIAAAAVLFHPAVSVQRSWRLAGVLLLGASLLLPMLDVVVGRTVTALHRDHSGSTDHPFAPLAPGIRVSSATLEGAKLLRRLSHEWLPDVFEAQKNRFSIDNDPSSNGPAAAAAWAEDVVEAAQAFREKGLAATAHRYAVVAFTDPFSQLLGLTPARGMTLAMELTRTVPSFGPPEAARYLADADGIFVSKCVLSNGGPTLREVFAPVYEAPRFTRVPLNACWDFYYHQDSEAAPQG